MKEKISVFVLQFSVALERYGIESPSQNDVDLTEIRSPATLFLLGNFSVVIVQFFETDILSSRNKYSTTEHSTRLN